MTFPGGTYPPTWLGLRDPQVLVRLKTLLPAFESP